MNKILLFSMGAAEMYPILSSVDTNLKPLILTNQYKSIFKCTFYLTIETIKILLLKILEWNQQ